MEISPDLYAWLNAIDVIPSNELYNLNNNSTKWSETIVQDMLCGKIIPKILQSWGNWYNHFYKLKLNYTDVLSRLELSKSSKEMSGCEKYQNWQIISECWLNFGLIYDESKWLEISEGNIAIIKEIIDKIYALSTEWMRKSIAFTPNNDDERGETSNINNNNNNINNDSWDNKNETSNLIINDISSIGNISWDHPNKTNLDRTNVSSKSQAVNINSLNANKNYWQCESPLEFILISICKNFKWNNRQAVALLSNNRKYWTVLCYRGWKNSFDSIINWFTDISLNIKAWIAWLKTTDDGRGMAFATIGVGWYSKNIEIWQKSKNILTELTIQLGFDWEWFETEGLDLIMLAINQHKDMRNDWLKALNYFVYDKYSDFTEIIQRKFIDKNTQLNICNFFIDIIPNWNLIGKCKEQGCEAFERNVTISILDLCIKNQCVYSKDMPTIITVLKTLWMYNSMSVNIPFDNTYKNMILLFFKEAIRGTKPKVNGINSKQASISCISGITNWFILMNYFAVNKIDSGPWIFKTLVFLFLENYDDIIKREWFWTNFSKFFSENKAVPIGIWVDPYLNQLHQVQNYEICDFVFWISIIKHSRFTVANAKSWMVFSIKTSVNNLLYAKCSNMLWSLIFSTQIWLKNQEIKEEMEKIFTVYVRDILGLYIKSEKSGTGDNAIMEIPYDILLEQFGSVNETLHHTIKEAVTEYRRDFGKHSIPLLAMLWLYPDHDDLLLNLEEQFSIENKKEKEKEKEKESKSIANNNNSSDNIRQSVEWVWKKIKTDKDNKQKKQKEQWIKQKAKEQKLQRNLEKQWAKKSLVMGVEQSHFHSIWENSTNNGLIQDEGSIIGNKVNNITAIIRPSSKMKLNTLIDFNQFNFIVKISEEEPREIRAIDGMNMKNKVQLKRLYKLLSNELGMISKSTLWKYIRERNFTNSDITWDELTLCIRNTFGQNINEVNHLQLKNLWVTISYWIMSKERKSYTLSECYGLFMKRILQNPAICGKDLEVKYKEILQFLRTHIDDPNILLPPGFKIVSKTKVEYQSKISNYVKIGLPEGKAICIELLNEMMMKIIGVGFLETYVNVYNHKDLDIDWGTVRNWSNGVMIAYAQLPQEYERSGIDVGDCVENMCRNICKGRDKIGNAVVPNMIKDKNEKKEKDNLIEQKKEELRLKRQNEIKKQVELYKKEKEENKQKQLLEKEKEENEKRKVFHDWLQESKKKNKKILEEINIMKKKKEEEKLQKLNDKKQKEAELELKHNEIKQQFFKNQNRRLQEQFKQIRTQKEELEKKKMEKHPSNQNLPTIPIAYLNKDREYNDFDKNWTTTMESVLTEHKEISNIFNLYEDHLKLLFEIYCKIGQNKLKSTPWSKENVLYINEYKDLLNNFAILNILFSTEQMNFVFKRWARKHETQGDNWYINYTDFKTSLIFLSIMSQFADKTRKIFPVDVDNLTAEKVNNIFDYFGFKIPYDRREIENVINERKGMNAKEFFEFQQKMKKEKAYLIKGKPQRKGSFNGLEVNRLIRGSHHKNNSKDTNTKGDDIDNRSTSKPKSRVVSAVHPVNIHRARKEKETNEVSSNSNNTTLIQKKKVKGPWKEKPSNAKQETKNEEKEEEISNRSKTTNWMDDNNWNYSQTNVDEKEEKQSWNEQDEDADAIMRNEFENEINSIDNMGANKEELVTCTSNRKDTEKMRCKKSTHCSKSRDKKMKFLTSDGKEEEWNIKDS